MPISRRRGLALWTTLEELSIHSDEEARIVGNHAGAVRAASLFPQYAVDWIIKAVDDIDHRPAESCLLGAEHKEELTELCTWWKGRMPQRMNERRAPPWLRGRAIVGSRGARTYRDVQVRGPVDFQAHFWRGAPEPGAGAPGPGQLGRSGQADSLDTQFL